MAGAAAGDRLKVELGVGYAAGPAICWSWIMHDVTYRYDAGAAVAACFAAGPIFCSALACGSLLMAAMDGAVPIGSVYSAFAIALIVVPLSSIVGAILACVPVAVGAMALSRLARGVDAAAAFGVWIAAGAAMGAIIGLVVEFDEPSPMLLLGVTGGACAALAWRGLRRG